MLGNFSFGDYFKKDAIQFAWDLLVDVYGMPVERLWFTVYTDDDEAAALWEEIGASRRTGSCGSARRTTSGRWARPDPAGRAPRSTSTAAPTRTRRAAPNSSTARATTSSRSGISSSCSSTAMPTGKLHPLPRPSIDTGAGLERIATVLQGVETNYDTDLFVPLLDAIGELVERPYDPASELAPAYRVIADHIRASAFLMTDGVVPSNEGRGYVLRRIIRRALRYGRKLGLDGAFLYTLLPVVNEMMGEQYPELFERHDVVATQLEQEERRFARTLNAGTDIAGRELERIKRSGETVVPGRMVFDLYQTHGIPSELVEEFAQEEGLTLDHEGFEEALKIERERGQASWKGDLAAQFREEYEELADRGVRSDVRRLREARASIPTVIALIGEDGLEDQLERR